MARRLFTNSGDPDQTRLKRVKLLKIVGPRKDSLIHQWINAENTFAKQVIKKSERKVQGVPQSQTAALPRPQEEEETDKSKQAQTDQTYEKHSD